MLKDIIGASEEIKLYTERLILRFMKPQDAADMFEYAQREDVTKNLLWSPHESVDFTRAYLKQLQKVYRRGDYYDFAVTLKDSGKLIGTCGIVTWDKENRACEIGYVINPDYRGKGYAPEAANAVCDFAQDRLGVHRIYAKHMAENEASHRVMEKIGMKYEGTHKDMLFVKGKYRTVVICAKIVGDEKAI